MDSRETLYRENSSAVYAFLLSLCHDSVLAEELTQETLFRAMMNIDAFRGTCALSVWLCQIAKNLYYEWQRTHRKTVPLQEYPETCAGELHELDTKLADQETAWKILEYVHLLDDPYKEVFLLHALGDVPLKEISRLFQKSDSWARVTYYRAKNRILEKMKEGSS